MQAALSIGLVLKRASETPTAAEYMYVPVIGVVWLTASAIATAAHLRKAVWHVAPRVFVSAMSTWIAFFTVYVFLVASVAQRCTSAVGGCDWSPLRDPLVVVLNALVLTQIIVFCALDVRRGSDTAHLVRQLHGAQDGDDSIELSSTDAYAASLISDATKQSPKRTD